MFVFQCSEGGVGCCFPSAHAIYFSVNGASGRRINIYYNQFSGEKYAENKNKPCCGKTVQENRNGQNCLFEIPCKPYFDKKEPQEKTVLKAETAYRQIEYKSGEAAYAERVTPDKFATVTVYPETDRLQERNDACKKRF